LGRYETAFLGSPPSHDHPVEQRLKRRSRRKKKGKKKRSNTREAPREGPRVLARAQLSYAVPKKQDAGVFQKEKVCAFSHKREEEASPGHL
jgi:hypothetical protein